MKSWKGKLVQIKWLDSQFVSKGWCYVNHKRRLKLPYCFTVGWVVKESRKGILVVQNIGKDGQVSNGMKIARCQIEKIRRIK